MTILIRSKKAVNSARSSSLGSVVDLFCGVGGLSFGFLKEGFEVVAGIDTDISCKYAFETNNNAPFIDWDISGLTGKMINRLFGKNKPKILIGCAPCQPFSLYTQKKEDQKWKLLVQFSRLIEESEPDIISMENVSRLVDFKGGEVFQGFVRRLERKKYKVTWEIVYCPDYGVPQSRKRLVLIASKKKKIQLIPPTHKPNKYPSVKDFISKLPPIVAGEQDEHDPLHRAAGMSKENMKRVRAAKPGGSWKDWNEELIADCHKKSTGKSYGSVYGRMTWDNLAPTLTTQCYGFGNGRFGHPEQDRALSLREAALLQTFPRGYKFLSDEDNWHTTTLGRQIGNAVPVKLARVIAKSIALSLGKK